MVCIFSCHFKFSTSTLEFYSWIQYWKTFLNLSFSFWTQLFYLTLLAVHFPLALSNYTVKPCNFQLNKQIVIHCCFLLVLMPEPVLYIWLRCQFCIRYSLAAFCQSPHQISNSTSYIFNSTFEFLFTLQWSMVGTKEAFVGVPDGYLSTSSPGSFVHHAFWKRESVGNTRLLPQAKMFENVACPGET